MDATDPVHDDEICLLWEDCWATVQVRVDSYFLVFVGLLITCLFDFRHVVPKPRDQCTKGEQLVVTFAAGYIAGVFCAIVSHPADTVVSKMNAAKGSTAGETLKKLGLMGVWQGLTPRIIMIGTLTAAQWFIYDAVKVWLGLPRPPPPEMPESLKAKLAAAQH